MARKECGLYPKWKAIASHPFVTRAKVYQNLQRTAHQASIHPIASGYYLK